MDWKIIFKSFKNKDMRRRVLIILGLIVIYRFLSHIPVPMAEPTQLKNVVSNLINTTDFGGFMNLLSGGALTSISIMLVGMSPFITSSIIFQLLSKAIPKLEELNKDGETGRRKINQWTRVITVPMALIQSGAFVFILRQTVLAGSATAVDNSLASWVMAITSMAAGSILLMWLGELITEQGVGNGISLIIFAGIVSQLPSMIGSIASSLFRSGAKMNVFNWFELPVDPTAFWISLGLIISSVIILYILVKINEAQRILVINYAKRVQGNSNYGGVKSILPIKLIIANVTPIIFAVAFLSFPSFIGQVLKATNKPALIDIANNLIKWFQAPAAGSFTGSSPQAFIYPALYFVLVVIFTFFYTSIIFNSEEIADNMQKQGGFIKNVRPGKQTEKYLNSITNRLTLFGSLALGFVAILPFIAEFLLFHLTGVTGTKLSVSGTGLLIIISVALESLRQINSRALMVTYDDYN